MNLIQERLERQYLDQFLKPICQAKPGREIFSFPEVKVQSTPQFFYLTIFSVQGGKFWLPSNAVYISFFLSIFIFFNDSFVRNLGNQFLSLKGIPEKETFSARSCFFYWSFCLSVGGDYGYIRRFVMQERTPDQIRLITFLLPSSCQKSAVLKLCFLFKFLARQEALAYVVLAKTEGAKSSTSSG